MAEAETVDSLELVISARAGSASEAVKALATSVKDFGEEIGKHIGNMKEAAGVFKDIANATKGLSGVKSLRGVFDGASKAATAAKNAAIGKSLSGATAKSAVEAKAAVEAAKAISKPEYYYGAKEAAESRRIGAETRASGRQMYEDLQTGSKVKAEAKAAAEGLAILEQALSDNTPEMIASKRRRAAKMNGGLEAYDKVFSAGIPAMADKGVAAGLITEETARAMKEAAGFGQELQQSVGQTAQEFMQAHSQADLLQMKLEGVKEALEDALSSDKQDPTKIARLAEQYDKLSEKISECGEAAEDVKSSSVSMRGVLAAVGKTIEKSIVGQLIRVAKMRGLRAIVRSLAAGFKEGLSNMYQWSKGLGGSFAGAMDTFASKIMWAKNSIATAFAPALQALVPVISTVVSWINTASNALAQFLALLTGRSSWTMATETAEEWAAAATAGAGGVSAAHEEMKDLLADWDELNIIQSESGSGGGGGGGGGGAGSNFKDMFEETNKFDEWTKYFDEIKTAVIAIGAGIAAWFIADTIQDFLSKIGIAGETVSGIFSKIKKGIAGAVLLTIGFELSKAAGKSYANNGFSWGAFAANVIGAISTGLGGKMILDVFGVNPAISLTLGIGLSIVGTIIAYNMERAKNAQDYIRERLEKEVYGFDVQAYAEKIDVTIQSAETARAAVRESLSAVLTDLNEVRVGLNKDASEDNLYNDLMGQDGLMSRIKTSLAADKNVVTLWFQMQQKPGTGLGATDENGNYTNLDSYKLDVEAFSTLEKLYNDLGTQLGESFVRGETGYIIAEGKESLVSSIVEQISEAQNAAARAMNEASMEIALINGLKGTDAKTVLANFPKVVKEQEKIMAESQRKLDEQQFATLKSVYAQLESLGVDAGSDMMTGLDSQIKELKSKLETEDYEITVHAEFAESTAELVRDFYNQFKDKVSASDVAVLYTELFKGTGIGLDQILSESDISDLLESMMKENFHFSGDELKQYFKDTLGVSDETIEKFFGSHPVSEAKAEAPVPEEIKTDSVTVYSEYVDEDTEDWSLADEADGGGEYGKQEEAAIGQAVMDAANEWWDEYRKLQQDQERQGGDLPESAWDREGELFAAMETALGDGFDAFWANIEKFIEDQQNPWGTENLPDWATPGATQPALPGGNPDEPIQVDVSGQGLATDDSVNGVAGNMTEGFGMLQAIMTAINKGIDSVAESSRITASKDFSVTVYPSAAFGGLTGASNRMRNKTTGEAGG